MKPLFLTLSATALLLSSPAFAETDTELNVEHYEAPQPKTKAEAFETFEIAAKEIKTIGNGSLAGNDLERIHELSYALENAVETMQLSAKDAAQTHAVSTLAEVVEEIHVASEEHEASKVKTHISSLQPAYGKAKTLLND